MSSTPAPREATRLGELTPRQWKSGIAAWLGWLFDGLELHLYTLVAAPLVMQLLQATSSADPAVKEKSAYIQAAFLFGWAAGGAFFGRLGDRLAHLLRRAGGGRLPPERYGFERGALAAAEDRLRRR